VVDEIVDEIMNHLFIFEFSQPQKKEKQKL
jgi:hypothetical protein